MDKRARAAIFRERLAGAMTLAGTNRSALARMAGVDRSTVAQLLGSDLPRLPNDYVRSFSSELAQNQSFPGCLDRHRG